MLGLVLELAYVAFGIKLGIDAILPHWGTDTTMKALMGTSGV